MFRLSSAASPCCRLSFGMGWTRHHHNHIHLTSMTPWDVRHLCWHDSDSCFQTAASPCLCHPPSGLGCFKFKHSLQANLMLYFSFLFSYGGVPKGRRHDTWHFVDINRRSFFQTRPFAFPESVEHRRIKLSKHWLEFASKRYIVHLGRFGYSTYIEVCWMFNCSWSVNIHSPLSSL